MIYQNLHGDQLKKNILISYFLDYEECQTRTPFIAHK